MAEKITVEEALKRARDIVQKASIHGLRERDLDLGDARSCTFHFEQTWAVDASLTVDFRIEDERVPKEVDKKKEFYARPEIRVSWGSSMYDTLAAVAAADLHMQVAKLAALVEAVLRRPVIVYVKEGK
jgi:hypothetical protein